MKIAVVHQAPYRLLYYASALEALVDRGDHLVLVRPDRFGEVKLPAVLRKRRGVSTAMYPWKRKDGLDRPIAMMRSVRDFARFQAPALRSSHQNSDRSFERVLRSVAGKQRSLAYEGTVPAVELGEDEWTRLDELFGNLERLVPADEGLVTFLGGLKLDALVCIARVNIAARDAEVIKAARQLEVPTGIVVYSWDNLSSKGLIHEHPDRVFVWNDVQAEEARDLHRIDPARIVVTGAPRFDPVFASSPSASRAELLGELGIDPSRATVLYLGSSTFIAPEEPAFVDRWLSALRSSGDERIRQANVIVRQHPGTAASPAWVEWSSRDPLVSRPPAVIRRRAQDLYDQLSASDVAVALNTSAEIEAAIVGKPVLTIKAGDLAPGQEGSLHFRYLLAEDGGFVETAETLEEHVGQLSRTLAEDPLAATRQRFLQTFVRPRGLDLPAGPVLADAIEELTGAGKPALVTARG